MRLPVEIEGTAAEKQIDAASDVRLQEHPAGLRRNAISIRIDLRIVERAAHFDGEILPRLLAPQILEGVAVKLFVGDGKGVLVCVTVCVAVRVGLSVMVATGVLLGVAVCVEL